MKFTEIIREAGFDPEAFPNASNISVTLYDRKDRIDTDETIHYVEPLFAHNPKSQKKFYYSLCGLEQSDIQTMNIKIDEFTVWLFYKTPAAKFFLRFSHE